MQVYRREKYLKAIRGFYHDEGMIKVIMGVRRCGKSCLMRSIADELVESGVPESAIVFIDLDARGNRSVKTPDRLEALIDSSTPARAGGTKYLFVDEIQNVEGFEDLINGYRTDGGWSIFITGSNAFLLSSDLATLFTGRTFELEVFPFSFSEFCEYYGRTDVDDAFDDYALQGGMSGSYLYKNPVQRFKYIADVFRTLVMRDIVQRHNVRNKVMLDKIGDFMLDNVSNITSARSVANALGSGGSAPNHKTVGAYIGYLCDAFALYRIRRYDIRGKKYLAFGVKYYLADHSFKYALLGTRDMDWGRTYENIVAIELLRRGYEVYVGTLYKKEIDFVAIRQSEKTYI